MGRGGEALEENKSGILGSASPPLQKTNQMFGKRRTAVERVKQFGLRRGGAIGGGGFRKGKSMCIDGHIDWRGYQPKREKVNRGENNREAWVKRGNWIGFGTSYKKRKL